MCYSKEKKEESSQKEIIQKKDKNKMLHTRYENTQQLNVA